MKAKHILKVNLLFMAYAFSTSQGSAEIQFQVNEGAWSETPDFANVSGEVVLKVKDTDKRQFFVWDGLPSGYEFQEEDRSIVKFTMPATAPNINCWSIPTSVYEPLKSIETTGSNWIDTGILATDNMVISAEITMLTGKAKKGIFGADYLQLRTSGGAYYPNGTPLIDANWSQLGVRNSNNDGNKYVNVSTPKKAVYKFEGGKFYVDGTSKADIYNKAFTSTRSIYLSHVNDDGLSPAALIIHSFSIKNKEGNFERMMIPARIKETGELGMFDVVAKNFHGKQGTGDFIAGPEAMLSKKYNSAQSGWGICLKVSGYNGTSTLTGVPVLVRISENIPGFRYSKTLDGGLDIFFATDEKGENRLAHDIDTWNKDGTSLVWVKLPKLSGKETKFYMFYGSKSVAMCPASTEVWSSYITVLHMNSYGENGIVDETGHGYNAIHKSTESETTTPESTILAKSTGAFGSSTLRTYPEVVANGVPYFVIPNYNKSLTNTDDINGIDYMPETFTAMIYWKRNWHVGNWDHPGGWYNMIRKGSDNQAAIESGGADKSARFGWECLTRTIQYGGHAFYKTHYASNTAAEYDYSVNYDIKDKDRLMESWNYNVMKTDGINAAFCSIYGKSEIIGKERDEIYRKGPAGSKIGKNGQDIILTAGEYDEVRITREAFSDDRVDADYEMMKNPNFVVSEGESFRLAKGFSIAIR